MGRVIACEIRSDTAKGGGWDVRLLPKGELGLSKMCATHERAQFVAQSRPENQIRAGYRERIVPCSNHQR